MRSKTANFLLRRLIGRPRGLNGNGSGHGQASTPAPTSSPASVAPAQPQAHPPLKPRLRKQREIDMTKRARSLGVAMTESEIRAAVSSMPVDMHGRVTPKGYQRWLLDVTQPAKERQALLEFIGKVDEGKSVQLLFAIIDVIGTSLYAALGTIYAGEAGMHVLGATLCGCVSGLGGGTLNNLMMGRVPVFWMVHPRYVFMCVGASIPTFYLWPYVQEALVKREAPKMQPDEHGRILIAPFEAWLHKADPVVARLEAVVKKELELDVRPTARQVFNWLDGDTKGFLSPEDLHILSRLSSIESPLLYAVNSVCLCIFAVSGAQQGILSGMHPVVCAVAGVSVCFGGIIRDLLCKRNVSVGVESFAVSTGLGASTYVAMRQLVLRGFNLPIELRIGTTCAVVLAVQTLAWRRLPDQLLPPMRTVNLDWSQLQSSAAQHERQLQK